MEEGGGSVIYFRKYVGRLPTVCLLRFQVIKLGAPISEVPEEILPWKFSCGEGHQQGVTAQKNLRQNIKQKFQYRSSQLRNH